MASNMQFTVGPPPNDSDTVITDGVVCNKCAEFSDDHVDAPLHAPPPPLPHRGGVSLAAWLLPRSGGHQGGTSTALAQHADHRDVEMKEPRTATTC